MSRPLEERQLRLSIDDALAGHGGGRAAVGRGSWGGLQQTGAGPAWPVAPPQGAWQRLAKLLKRLDLDDPSRAAVPWGDDPRYGERPKA